MSPGSPKMVRDHGSTLYFMSDAHLGGSPEPHESTKRERLLALFEQVQTEEASLYVLGDLFDFWFEYRTVIPASGFRILARLADLASGGIQVRYLGGNHDFWMSAFLARETGIEVLDDGVLLQAQGRQIRLFHGDGLGGGDTGYKVMKRLLRNPLAIRMFRWLHPDLGIPLALRTSGVSREQTAGYEVDVDRLYREVALPELRGVADAVLMGHHHVAVHRQEETGEFLILGDWFREYTCARLRGGRLELLRWPLDE